MPKLLVFAPCEKAIISKEDNTPSLIGVITGFKVHGNEQLLEQTMRDAESEASLVAVRWAIFTMWARQPSDGTKEFTQAINLESPSGKIVFTERSSFAFIPTAGTHRVIVGFTGFPLSERGTYVIRLSLDGSDVAEYPLELKLEKPETAATPQNP